MALLLRKGNSHKRTAQITGRSERTVRQQAVAVYRKAGLAGRAELAGYFLGDLLLASQRSVGGTARAGVADAESDADVSSAFSTDP